ncbi:MAG: aminoacyl-tRNA hydrolase [Candidatus Aminicenantes bacterium]|nr:aminoacyl-tRNA hydrolase [Candidatus Aminicenantes bacterium]
MWAVVGLGNPGLRYAETRHNVGFMLVRRAAKDWEIRLRKPKFSAKTGEGRRAGERVVLALPETYMNESGQAVKALIVGMEIPTEHLVVVFDDVDLALGEIRVRRDGGPGTHRGMTSIVGLIGPSFPRIRVGIGPVPEGTEITDFVLEAFRPSEKKLLAGSLDRAMDALELVLDGQIDQAMNRYN